LAGRIILLPVDISPEQLEFTAKLNTCAFARNDDEWAKHQIAQAEWEDLMNQSEKRWNYERPSAFKCKAEWDKYNKCKAWRMHWHIDGPFYDIAFPCIRPKSATNCAILIAKHFPEEDGIAGYPGYQVRSYPTNKHIMYC